MKQTFQSTVAATLISSTGINQRSKLQGKQRNNQAKTRLHKALLGRSLSNIVLRTLLALFGSYLIGASFTSLFSQLWLNHQAMGVLMATMLSFLLLVAVVIFAFSVRSIRWGYLWVGTTYVVMVVISMVLYEHA